MMKNSKSALNKLLKNNKFLFLIAVIISVSIWIYMSLGTTNDTTVTVTNIPIQVEMSEEALDNGLKIFSGADQTASVTVTGNRAILGAIKESDITITAAANTINSSGDYQLSVSASKTNPTMDFQIVSNVNPPTISVVVDYLRDSTFQIQENVVCQVADGFYASTALSSKSVLISGPQTVISKIAKVSAAATVNGLLSDSVTTNAQIILYDKDGEEISQDLLTMEFNTVEATVSVIPEKNVKVTPVFVNKPEGLIITEDMFSIEPESILIAGPKEVLEATTTVNLEAIDFSNMQNEKINFPSLGIDIPSDCKNISNTASASLTLDLNSMSSKALTVSNFVVEGLSDNYKADVTQNILTVTVIGPESELEKLNETSVIGVIDTSDYVGTIGSVRRSLGFRIKGSNKCWVYGSYEANLTISKK